MDELTIKPIEVNKVKSNLTFHDESRQQVGELTWEDGIFKFEGKTKESARVFFNWLNEFRGLNDQTGGLMGEKPICCHSCCEHKVIWYCKKCDKVYCGNCDKTWGTDVTPHWETSCSTFTVRDGLITRLKDDTCSHT